jgi:hypothetical protein
MAVCERFLSFRRSDDAKMAVKSNVAYNYGTIRATGWRIPVGQIGKKLVAEQDLSWSEGAKE